MVLVLRPEKKITLANRFKRVRSRLTLLLAILFFSPLLIAFSQHNNFVYYSVNEGLSQATVFKIIQDSRGYIWVGTGEGGVSRFDGKNFKNLGLNDGLPGLVIRDIIEDSRGWIWIGTEKGIAIYDGYSFNALGSEEGLSGEIITSLFEDSHGAIWVGTGFGGLNRIEIEKNKQFRIKKISEAEGLGSYQVWSILEDVHGRLWVGLPAGINVICFQEDTFRIDHLGSGDGVPEDVVYSIESDWENNLWFGTGDSGVYKIEDIGPDQYGTVTRFDSKNGFTNNSVWDLLCTGEEIWFGTGDGLLYTYSRTEGMISSHGFGLEKNEIFDICRDEEGIMWLGTNGRGICKLLGKRFSHYKLSDGLPGNIINGITQDRNGVFWLASYDEGLIRMTIDDGSVRFSNYTTMDGLASNSLNDLTIDPEGNLWIATHNNGFSKFDGRSFHNYSFGGWMIDDQVNCVLAEENNTIWLGTNSGIVHFDGAGYFLIDEEKGLPFNEVVSLLIDRPGNLWIGTFKGLARYDKQLLYTFDESNGIPVTEITALVENEDGIIWIATGNQGIYKHIPNYNDPEFEMVITPQQLHASKVTSLIAQEKNILIAGSNRGFQKIYLDKNQEVMRVIDYDVTDGFFGIENNQGALFRDKMGRIWFGTINGITRYDPDFDPEYSNPPRIHFTGLDLFYESIDWKTKADSIIPFSGIPEALKLKFTDNHLTFKFQALYFTNPQKIRYQYMLEGREGHWSPPVAQENITYSGLTPGEYSFLVKAGTETGEWTPEPLQFSFVIKPPFYKTWWFILILVALSIIAIVSYIKYREKQLILEKRILEEKVQERTAEIRKQKTQIEEKNRNLREANQEITRQKEIIEKKNIDITDSIKYAKRIQDAVLPSERILNEYLADAFILFKPKDIVSGDFYWVKEAGDLLIVVAADCTGHGVPGAFMSLLGITFLNEIVEKNHITSPEKILDLLRENVITALKQKGLESESKDGMDIAICTINRKANYLEYSGANNPMYYIRNDRLLEIKADRMPVAIHSRMKEFSNHKMDLHSGDTVYLFSDGYADQFGGPSGKKLKYTTFKEILLSVQGERMQDQKEILDRKHLEWKGTFEQVDDIVVLGFKV